MAFGLGPVGDIGAHVALGAVSAFEAIFNQPVHWRLLSLDDGTEIEGQFHAQDLTENVSGNWSEATTIGLVQPILQFVSGNLDTISFGAKVWAKHQGVLGTGLLDDNVKEIVDQLRELPRKDPKLGRPHIWLLAIGNEFLQRVVVRGVGGIKYDRFRGSDGTIRGAMFQFDLARYEPYDIKQLVEAESLITPAREGETYEHIARRELGDPILGEALRRRNPDRLLLEPGDLVHVPRARILRAEVLPLTPQALWFKEGRRQRRNLVRAFKERGGYVPTHVLSDDWSG